jgi:ABC-type branched-subunit amino acid transport system ATPase component
VTKNSPPALTVDAVSVHFGGVSALNSVSLSVAPETVHGIIGPNGSGKTTMLNAICGFVRYRGVIQLFDHSLTGLASHRRVARGLGRTFQNPKVGDLSVEDLLRIGEYRRKTRPLWKEAIAPWLSDREAEEFRGRAQSILDQLDVHIPSLAVPVASLPHGVIKMLDVARSLMGAPSLVLLDEPTAGLNEMEIAILRERLSGLRKTAIAITVVLVEHNLRFLHDVCDHVTVLDAGRRIADGSIAEVLGRPEVITAYLGSDPS